jgi:hypothetical protein
MIWIFHGPAFKTYSVVQLGIWLKIFHGRCIWEASGCGTSYMMESFMDYLAIDRLPDWIFLLQSFQANSNIVTSNRPQLLPFMSFLIHLSYDLAIHHLRWHDFRWYITNVILLLGLTGLLLVLWNRIFPLFRNLFLLNWHSTSFLGLNLSSFLQLIIKIYYSWSSKGHNLLSISWDTFHLIHALLTFYCHVTYTFLHVRYKCHNIIA